MGFEGNNFFSFIIDYKQDPHDYYNYNKFTDREILDNIKVEGVDFKCLHDGLKAKKVNRDKYPCLKQVVEPLYIN